MKPKNWVHVCRRGLYPRFPSLLLCFRIRCLKRSRTLWSGTGPSHTKCRRMLNLGLVKRDSTARQTPFPPNIPARSGLEMWAMILTAIRKTIVGMVRHRCSGMEMQIRIVATKIMRTCRPKRSSDLPILDIIFFQNPSRFCNLRRG